MSTVRRPVLAAMSQPGARVLAVLALTWVVFAPNYWVYMVTAAIPLAVAAYGLLVLQGWAREISLAQAALFATALYTFGWLNRPDNLGYGIPWLIAGVLSIGMVALLMTAVAAASIRLPGIYLIVLTLGLQVTLEKVVFTEGRLSGGISGGTELGKHITNPRPWFFGLDLSGDTTFYYFSLGWLALVLILMVRLRRCPAGLAAQLVGEDRQAAAGVGIAPLRHRLAAFAVSGALAGLGGMLASWLFINPPVFTNYLAPQSLLLLAIPVLAGRDAIAGLIVVAVAFQVIPFALEAQHVNTFLLAGTGLVLGCATGPRGVRGRVSDLIERVRPIPLPPAFDDDAEQRERDLGLVRKWLSSDDASGAALGAYGIVVRIDGSPILNGVDIEIPAHGFVGLIGPNGAGKSTLFDVISGVRAADDGRIVLFGTDVTAAPAWKRARLGAVRCFQSTRVVDDLTVGENLLVGASTRVTARTAAFLAGSAAAWEELAEAESVAKALARLLGIERHWNRRCDRIEFSARRRVEIGRAILARPRVLLLDEPAVGLDMQASAALFSLVDQLHSDLGLTVLLVEHDVESVLAHCSLIHVLAEGTVIATGTPIEIASHERVREVYLGHRVDYTPAT